MNNHAGAPETQLKGNPLKHLRTGYTTGACAAAAAKGAALMLLHRITVREVSISLPTGEIATFQLHGQLFAADEARCHVIKDAGDDPDITNGVEVHAAVSRSRDSGTTGNTVVISGGTGIGRVTKPGLAVPPGEWAINPVPRRMIEDAVRSVFTIHASPVNLQVTISIPDGEERSKKTLNARLGIIGGLSILGTTGIVRPISAKAWTDTIDAALDVARACDCGTVVLSTGRTSEMGAQRYLAQTPPHVTGEVPGVGNTTITDRLLPEEAYIMMGDHIAYALNACKLRGFLQPVIACQFAKLLKIACRHENTHVAASVLDLEQLLKWAREDGLPESILETVSNANTAREIAIACSFNKQLLKLLLQRVLSAADNHAGGTHPHILVVDYSGNCIHLHETDTP